MYGVLNVCMYVWCIVCMYVWCVCMYVCMYVCICMVTLFTLSCIIKNYMISTLFKLLQQWFVFFRQKYKILTKCDEENVRNYKNYFKTKKYKHNNSGKLQISIEKKKKKRKKEKKKDNDNDNNNPVIYSK